MKKIVEEISLEAQDLKEKEQNITSEYVKEKLSDIIEDEDLSRYIL